MAKSNLSWDLDGHILTVTVLATKTKVSLDLTKLFAGFDKMSDVQQKIVAYGVKQKLADKVAKPLDEKLTPSEMVAELKALWEQLVKGIWRVAAESRETIVQKAWDKASKADRKILEKLGLKPKPKPTVTAEEPAPATVLRKNG